MVKKKEQERLGAINRELHDLQQKALPLVAQLERFFLELGVGTFRVHTCGAVFTKSTEKKGFFCGGHPIAKCDPRTWISVLNNIPEVLRSAERRMRSDIHDTQQAIETAKIFLDVMAEQVAPEQTHSAPLAPRANPR